MDPKKDYYKILGVPEGASAEEIRKAFRRLAKKHHPDVNPGDKAAETRFKEANEAHEILGDRKKREEYDAIRQGGFAGGFHGAGPFGAAGNAPGGFRAEAFDLGDLFGDVLRGGGARFSHPGRGSDIRVEISVDFLVLILLVEVVRRGIPAQRGLVGLVGLVGLPFLVLVAVLVTPLHGAVLVSRVVPHRAFGVGFLVRERES